MKLLGKWFLCGLGALALVAPAQAQVIRRVSPLKRTVKLVARTAVNMATCHDRELCAEQWGGFLAGSMDAHSTDLYLKYCPTCLESNSLFGPRPSSARTWGTLMGFNFLVAVQAQGIHELAQRRDSWTVRHVLPALGSAMYIGVEIHATTVNYSVANRFKKCAETVGCFYK